MYMKEFDCTPKFLNSKTQSSTQKVSVQLQKLVYSTPSQFFKVLKTNGGSTKY